MRGTICVLLAVSWLAACGQQPADNPVPAVEPASPAGEEEVIAAEPGAVMQSVKVQGGQLDLPFSFTVRSDRMAITSQSKVDQRQLRIEVESASSIEAVLAQAADGLAALGYRAGEVSVEEDGGLRQHFRKEGVDNLRIRLNPPGDKVELKNDAAQYSLYLTETAPIPRKKSD